MKKSQVYHFFNIIFAFLLTVILIGTVFDNQSQIKNTKISLLLFSITIVLFILICICYLLKKTKDIVITKRRETCLFMILMILIIIVEVFCGYNLAVSGARFDLGNIIDMVDNITNGKTIPSVLIAYYMVCPNNKFLTFILVYVYKFFNMFGITNRLLPGIAVNILFITIAIVIMYLIIRKLYSNRVALIMLGFVFLLTPLFLYVPIFYTDTMSMPFIMLVLYMYLFFKEERNLRSKKGLLSFVLLNISAIIGIQIKATVGIILIAIYIDMILTSQKIKNSIFMILLSICMVTIVSSTSNLLVDRSQYFKEIRNPKLLPYTNWIMVGLNEFYQIDKSVYEEGDFQYDSKDERAKMVYGVWDFHEFFYATDVIQDIDMNFYENLLQSDLTYDQINSRCIAMIQKRLKERGILGTIHFAYRKRIQTWGDGTYYAPAKLSRFPIRKENILAEFVRLDGKYFDIYYYFSHAIQVLMLFLILLSTIRDIKNFNTDFNVLRVSLFGLMLFLTIWETRSRYIVNYILIMYILMIPVIANFITFLTQNKKCNVRKKRIL